MASLLDIGDLTEKVTIRGVELTVQGLSAGHVFQLFSEIPNIRKMMETKQGNIQALMLELAPDLLARIIAMVLGEPNNKEVEAKAKTLGAGEQLAILSAMQRLSFQNGIGPFVEEVTAMMTSAVAALPQIHSPTSSNSMTASPAQFNASLQTDTPPGLRGHARRVN